MINLSRVRNDLIDNIKETSLDISVENQKKNKDLFKSLELKGDKTKDYKDIINKYKHLFGFYHDCDSDYDDADHPDINPLVEIRSYYKYSNIKLEVLKEIIRLKLKDNIFNYDYKINELKIEKKRLSGHLINLNDQIAEIQEQGETHFKIECIIKLKKKHIEDYNNIVFTNYLYESCYYEQIQARFDFHKIIEEKIYKRINDLQERGLQDGDHWNISFLTPDKGCKHMLEAIIKADSEVQAKELFKIEFNLNNITMDNIGRLELNDEYNKQLFLMTHRNIEYWDKEVYEFLPDNVELVFNMIELKVLNDSYIVV